MKILLIHQYYLEEGESGGSRWNEFTRLWANEENKITVLAGTTHYTTGEKNKKYKGKIIYEENEIKNIRIIRCHVSESYNKHFIGRLWAYFSFVLSGIYAGIFKAREKYDCIIVSSPPLFVGITGYVLSAVKRIPLVFEVRDLWPESVVDAGVVKNKIIIKIAFLLEKLFYKKATLITVLTPAFMKILIEEKNIPPKKIIYIPNAADFSMSEKYMGKVDVHELRKELGWDDKFVIIYVGAHGVANSLTQLVNAAELLRNEPVLFACIGDGMEKAQLMAEVKKRNLNNVQFYAPVAKQQVFKYIIAADIGTSVLKNAPIFKTIFSNKTFDYMSCKKPVLMAIDGISKQLIEDADAGIFTPPENAREYAEKVKFYLHNADEVLRQGENGYNFVKKHFDRNSKAKKYIGEIKKCLGIVQVNETIPAKPSQQEMHAQ